jgi:cytochrome c oxidase subunit 4
MAEQAHPVEHSSGHPSSLQYVKIFVVLFVLTALEVGAVYLEPVRHVLAFILLALAAIKFSLVAAYYMHLKFDSPLFTWFFAGGIALAISIGLAFASLFGTWWHVPHVPGAGGH